jgi:oligosaccharide repeat unit polymerase
VYNPARVALAGMVAWLFFWLVTPVYPTADLSATAMLYIGVCYLGFFVGCAAYPLMTGVSERTFPASEWQQPAAYGLFWISTVIGLAGMALRLYDRVALRGVDYSAGASELRETLSSVGAGSVGAIAAVLFPFCLVPLVVLLASKFKPRQIPLYILATAVFFLPTIESLAQLSRSVLLSSVVMVFAAITCAKFRGNPANRKLLLATVGGIVLMSVASTTIFVSRLEGEDRQLSASVIQSVYADNLQPNEAAWTGLMAGSDLEKRYYSIILPNGMYYISGAYEFSTLWLRPDRQTFAYGAYNFIAFARAFQILFSPTAEPIDEAALVYRIGVFQTFFGNAWVDFGYFAPLVLVALGFFCRYLGLKARAGNLNVLPLYLFIVVIVFFMPVGNFVNGGLGNFILGAFGLIAVFGPKRPRETGDPPARPAPVLTPGTEVSPAARLPG